MWTIGFPGVAMSAKLLGKEFVTDEDIWRLQRRGEFDDLVPPDGPPAEYPKLPPVYTGEKLERPKSKP